MSVSIEGFEIKYAYEDREYPTTQKDDIKYPCFLEHNYKLEYSEFLSSTVRQNGFIMPSSSILKSDIGNFKIIYESIMRFPGQFERANLMTALIVCITFLKNNTNIIKYNITNYFNSLKMFHGCNMPDESYISIFYSLAYALKICEIYYFDIDEFRSLLKFLRISINMFSPLNYPEDTIEYYKDNAGSDRYLPE
jgi:hypothetical protein